MANHENYVSADKLGSFQASDSFVGSESLFEPALHDHEECFFLPAVYKLAEHQQIFKPRLLNMDERFDLLMAWAIPIDTKLAGARLEAYVESKAAIFTFKTCIQHPHSGQALAKLSTELVEIIASHLRQSIFEEHLEWWTVSERCCLAECECDISDRKKHSSRKDDLMSKVGERGPTIAKAKFDKCRQVRGQLKI